MPHLLVALKVAARHWQRFSFASRSEDQPVTVENHPHRDFAFCPSADRKPFVPWPVDREQPLEKPMGLLPAAPALPAALHVGPSLQVHFAARYVRWPSGSPP